MTQEEKKLLLKDLCPRLPYATKVFYEYVDDLDKKTYGYSLTLNTWCINELEAEKAIVKPYLRPMSSMTDDERKEYNDIVKNTIDFYDCPKSEKICFFIIPIEWLNKHHFDYRGLIDKGLALEATEDIYKF